MTGAKTEETEVGTGTEVGAEIKIEMGRDPGMRVEIGDPDITVGMKTYVDVGLYSLGTLESNRAPSYAGGITFSNQLRQSPISLGFVE